MVRAGTSSALLVLVLVAAVSTSKHLSGHDRHDGTAGPGAYVGFQGVPQVTGPSAEDQESPRYRVSDEPRLQIGSANDGESALYRVTGAVRLRDGRIVVANAGTRELKFFDSNGVHLASTGQRGDGPGDFEHLGRIGALEDGRVAVMDMLLGRVSVFSADGVHDHTYQVSRGLGEAGSRIEVYGFLANGTLVGLQEVVGEGTEARYGDYPASTLVYRAPVVQPVLIDTLGQATPFGRTMPGDETLSEMQTTSGDGTLSVSGIGRIPMPFLNSAAVDVRDTLIVIGHTSGFDLLRGVPRRPIRVYDAEGEGRVFFTFGLDASVEVPEGARQEWVDRRISTFADRGARRQWRSRYEEFMSATPASLPRFKSLILQGGGNVWVEQFDPSADEEVPSLWWVNNLQDRTDDPLENTVELPPGFRPYDIGSDYVLGKWTDELGIEYVQLYDLIDVQPDGSFHAPPET